MYASYYDFTYLLQQPTLYKYFSASDMKSFTVILHACSHCVVNFQYLLQALL